MKMNKSSRAFSRLSGQKKSTRLYVEIEAQPLLPGLEQGNAQTLNRLSEKLCETLRSNGVQPEMVRVRVTHCKTHEYAEGLTDQVCKHSNGILTAGRLISGQYQK